MHGFTPDDLSELLEIAGEHFRANGYIDAWLFSVAADAVVRGNYRLAKGCLTAFEKRRTLYGLEVEIMRCLWELIEELPPMGRWTDEVTEVTACDE